MALRSISFSKPPIRSTIPACGTRGKPRWFDTTSHSLYERPAFVKWSELNAFSKFLFILMAAFVVAYLWSQLRPGPESARPALMHSPSSPLPHAGGNSSPISPADNKDEAKLVESLKSPQGSV